LTCLNNCQVEISGTVLRQVNTETSRMS